LSASDEVIDTLGVTLAITAFIMLELVPVVGTAHALSEVITHFIVSPFANEELVYVVEFVPELALFSFH
jgi:hypothetical protein